MTTSTYPIAPVLTDEQEKTYHLFRTSSAGTTTIIPYRFMSCVDYCWDWIWSGTLEECEAIRKQMDANHQ